MEGWGGGGTWARRCSTRTRRSGMCSAIIRDETCGAAPPPAAAAGSGTEGCSHGRKRAAWLPAGLLQPPLAEGGC